MARKALADDRKPAFGERMKELRKRHGLTQTDLAERMQTTQKAISHYERLARDPSLTRARQIAESLGVSLDELADVNNSTHALPEKRLRMWKRIERVFELPEKDQRNAVEMIEGLLARKGLLQAAGQ